MRKQTSKRLNVRHKDGLVAYNRPLSSSMECNAAIKQLIIKHQINYQTFGLVDRITRSKEILP